MAYINLQDVFATRSFFDGKGLEVEERFQKRDGSEGKTKYSVFFDQPHGIADGSKIAKLGGVAGVKARIWQRDDAEDMAVANITINSPKVEGVTGGGASAPADNPFGSNDSPF